MAKEFVRRFPEQTEEEEEEKMNTWPLPYFRANSSFFSKYAGKIWEKGVPESRFFSLAPEKGVGFPYRPA